MTGYAKTIFAVQSQHIPICFVSRYDFGRISESSAAECSENQHLIFVSDRDFEYSADSCCQKLFKLRRCNLRRRIACMWIHRVAWAFPKVRCRRGQNVYVPQILFGERFGKVRVAFEYAHIGRVDAIVVVQGIRCLAMRTVKHIPHLVGVETGI